MREARAREYWWAYVVAGLRSKVGATVLAIGLCATIWQFATGHDLAGVVVVAVLVFTFACPGAAIGAWLGVRERHRGA